MSDGDRYTWFLLADAGPECSPLVVLQGASAGSWEGDPKAQPCGEEPLGFWVVSSEPLGPVVHTSSGTLVSPSLAEEILARCPEEVRLVSAIVAHSRDRTPPVGYVLLRPLFRVPIARFREPTAAFSRIGYVAESPADVVVNAHLRHTLQVLGVPGLDFDEPKFA